MAVIAYRVTLRATHCIPAASMLPLCPSVLGHRIPAHAGSRQALFVYVRSLTAGSRLPKLFIRDHEPE